MNVPRLLACGIALLVVSGGCTPRSGREPPASSKTPAPARPAAPRPSPPTVDAAAGAPAPAPADGGAAGEPAELVVGTDRALEAWRRDGGGKRIISKGPARLPRWIDEQTVLVVRVRGGGTDLAGGGRLEKVSVADGKRTRIATIPRFACRPPAGGAPGGAGDDQDHAGSGFVPDQSREPLAVQDPEDFVIEDDGIACLALLDRNINMASVGVTVRVGLQTGKMTRTLTLGADECAPPPGVELGSPDAPCEARHLATPESADAAFPYAFDDARQHVVRRSPEGTTTPTLELHGYEANLGSPSGRWLVLAGDQEDGDYIHRNVVLLDRTTGEVFPIPGEPTARWPAPLAASAKRSPPRIRTPVAATSGIVGETDLRWLGRSPASELLIIDSLVVRPGAGAFSVKGDIAR